MAGNGLLKPVSIYELHKTILPTNYQWAGIIRSSNFAVNGSFGKINIDVGDTIYKIMPIDHSEINDKLKEFCLEWNSYLKTSDNLSLNQRIDVIAKFHYKFITIYPFMVANESVNWVLLRVC